MDTFRPRRPEQAARLTEWPVVEAAGLVVEEAAEATLRAASVAAVSRRQPRITITPTVAVRPRSIAVPGSTNTIRPVWAIRPFCATPTPGVQVSYTTPNHTTHRKTASPPAPNDKLFDHSSLSLFLSLSLSPFSAK